MPPANGQMGIEELMQMLMQFLTTAPQQPAGDTAGGTVPIGPPGYGSTPDPQAAGVMQLLQMLQMAQSQSPQQAQNAVSGQMGAMGGFMGGRPPGS